MSRSGYSDDSDYQWRHIMWRGAVNSAIKGKRGQAALREILAALDAMPEKWLAAESLATTDGEFCTLGVLGQARGIDMAPIDPEDWDAVANTFGIAPALVREIVYLNDESIDDYHWVDEELAGPVRPHWGVLRRSYRAAVPHPGRRRWEHMRKWVAAQIATAEGSDHG